MKLIFCFILLALSIEGCFQGTDSNESEVSGFIKLDGKPLPEGTITFISADNTTHSAQGKIQDGEYVVTVPVGKKRVEIHASRWTGKPYEKYDIMETEQYYSRMVSDRYEELQPFLVSDPAAKEMLATDMEELDEVYKELKKDLKDNASNPEVIEAMILNYRVKLEILEDLLYQLKEKENQDYEKDESYSL